MGTRRDVRKALDQAVLMSDLAALRLGVVLGGLNLLRGGAVLAGNLLAGELVSLSKERWEQPGGVTEIGRGDARCSWAF